MVAFVSRTLVSVSGTKLEKAVHDWPVPLLGLYQTQSKLYITSPSQMPCSLESPWSVVFFFQRLQTKNAQSKMLKVANWRVRERTTSQTRKGQALKAGFANDLRLHLACAMASGTVACLATQPVDCVKTRIINMQSTCVLVAGWCETLKGEGLHVQLLRVETIFRGAGDSVCIYLILFVDLKLSNSNRGPSFMLNWTCSALRCFDKVISRWPGDRIKNVREETILHANYYNLTHEYKNDCMGKPPILGLFSLIGISH